MCDYFSGVLLKSGKVLYDESNSHSKILSMNNIHDDGIFGEFLLFEIKQKEDEFAEPTKENWELLFQSMGGVNTFKIPDWYKDGFDERIWSFFRDVQNARIKKKKELEEMNRKRIEAERIETEKKEIARRKELAERLKISDFKITFCDDMLYKSCNVIKGLISEGQVKMTTEGITIIGMDPANVAMVVLSLPSSCAVEYKINGECKFGINLGTLSQILKNMKKNDIVAIENNKKEADKINIILKGESSRTYELGIVEIENECKIPNLDLKSEVIMPSALFHSQIAKANTVAESVVFTSSKQHFMMDAQGDLTKLTIHNKAGDDINITGDCKAKYSIEYLLKIAEAKKIANEVKLEFMDDYPLQATYELKDFVKLTLILAPRVDET